MTTTLIWTIIVTCSAIVIGISSNYFLKEDNLIEEAAEEVIKEKTGFDIDLTPSSKEEDKNPN